MILEEIKMVEDTPDDLVHELFTQDFWEGHPLGRPILGTPETVEVVRRATSLRELLRRDLRRAEPGHRRRPATSSTTRVRELVDAARSATLPAAGERRATTPPRGRAAGASCATKELEQSHVCLGTSSYPQNHDDRYVSYVLNTVLGGSMSSRLFQNVREKRGLAYAVFSGLSAYRDAGNADDLRRLRQRRRRRGDRPRASRSCAAMKQTPVPDAELRRAKDHLKGSLMLSLESTSSRMSHLARQEIYFDRQFGLDETLEGIERVTRRGRAARRARAVLERIAGRDGARARTARTAASSWIWDSGAMLRSRNLRPRTGH